MCIIAVKPEKIVLSRKQLEIMWASNPHGAGFMYAEGGKVHVSKGFTTLDKLWDAIEKVGPMRKMVLHFRIRTHGANSPEMTHPFWVRKEKLALVHNGVIHALVNETTDVNSDTAVFAKKLSQNYSDPLLAIQSPFHRDMLEAYLGNSKVVFMDASGQTYILNERYGIWNKGVWYSNDKFRAPTLAKKYTQTAAKPAQWGTPASMYKKPTSEARLNGTWTPPSDSLFGDSDSYRSETEKEQDALWAVMAEHEAQVEERIAKRALEAEIEKNTQALKSTKAVPVLKKKPLPYDLNEALAERIGKSEWARNCEAKTITNSNGDEIPEN